MARYVRYIGLSHQRMITAQDWRSVGINGDTMLWNAQNGFALPLELFTDDQVRKAIEPDAGFVITGEEDFTPSPMARDMVPAEAAQAAEAPVDVVDTLNAGVDASPARSGASSVASRFTTSDSDTRTDQDRLA